MTSSLSTGSMGTSTPVLGGVAGQGGELFKGFSALGNRVCNNFIRASLLLTSSNSPANGPPQRRPIRYPHLGCEKLLTHQQTLPRYPPHRSTHGLILGIQPIPSRDRRICLPRPSSCTTRARRYAWSPRWQRCKQGQADGVCGEYGVCCRRCWVCRIRQSGGVGREGWEEGDVWWDGDFGSWRFREDSGEPRQVGVLS